MPLDPRRHTRVGLTAAGLCLIAIAPALAATGGGALPWEGPLQQVQQSITGPVAGFIALAAVAIAGGMLIFGGELNDFARRLMHVVLVGGILLGATKIVGLFGATGASIGKGEARAAVLMAEPRRAFLWKGEGTGG